MKRDRVRDARAASVAAEYARLAPDYDERWKPYIERTVALTLERLPRRAYERVLDVGCGTGAVLAPLADRHPKAALHGVDPSRAMLDIAAARLGSRVALAEGRAEALPYGDETFDLVVSTSALHYVSDEHAAVAEMHRVARPGAHVLVTDWCADFLSMRAFGWGMRLLGKANFTMLGSAAFEALLSGGGFGEARIETHRIGAIWGVLVASATK